MAHFVTNIYVLSYYRNRRLCDFDFLHLGAYCTGGFFRRALVSVPRVHSSIAPSPSLLLTPALTRPCRLSTRWRRVQLLSSGLHLVKLDVVYVPIPTLLCTRLTFLGQVLHEGRPAWGVRL